MDSQAMCGRILGRVLTVSVVVLALGAVAGCGGAQARKVAHIERGRNYLAAQNYEKARIEFQNALQIDPKDVEAHYEVGFVDEKLGRLPQAAQSYQAALDLAPQHDDLEASIALARLMALYGPPERALELVKAAFQKHPNEPELFVLRAVARAQLKDLDGALGDAEHAVALAPKNQDSIATLAGIYKARGETEKARALIERAVQDIPDSVEMHFTLAEIYADDGRIADAETQYRKIIELQPQQSSHRLRLAEFYAKANELDAAESTLRTALKDFPAERSVKLSLVEFLAARRGRDAAEGELKKMIAAAPEDYELQFELARLYRAAGENQKAEAIYRAVIDKEGTDPPGLVARNGLARLRLQQNDLGAAIALANEVLAQTPRDNDALVTRGEAELARNDPRDAVADLRAALRDQPGSAALLRTLARAHLANGEPQIAEEVLRQAVEANPNNPALQSDLAQLLVRLGKSDEANTVMASAVDELPGNLQALDTQFRIAMTTKDLHRAQSAADAMVAAQPKLALGYVYQGVVAETEKHYEDALRLYTTAANLQPNAAEPLEAVVRVLAATNRLPEAIKRLDTAAAQNPRDALPLDVKGELLLQNGRIPEAKEAFRQAMVRAPRWWPPYRGMAKAELSAKEDLATVVDGLRRAETLVDQSERLGEVLAGLLVREGKTDQAVAEYEQTLRKYPKSEVAANNLAMLLVTYRSDSASLDQARDLAARFANSTNLTYRDTYGWVLYKRGEAAAAVPVFARIVAESPDAVIARYHLAMAQARAGNPAEARDNLTRVIDSGKHFPGLDDARATLERLSKSATDASPRT
jgi:tetratricopeptide (TPR) repeat protein